MSADLISAALAAKHDQRAAVLRALVGQAPEPTAEPEPPVEPEPSPMRGNFDGGVRGQSLQPHESEAETFGRLLTEARVCVSHFEA